MRRTGASGDYPGPGGRVRPWIAPGICAQSANRHGGEAARGAGVTSQRDSAGRAGTRSVRSDQKWPDRFPVTAQVTAASNATPSMLRAKRSSRSPDRVGFPAFMGHPPVTCRVDETTEIDDGLRCGSQAGAVFRGQCRVGDGSRTIGRVVHIVRNRRGSGRSLVHFHEWSAPGASARSRPGANSSSLNPLPSSACMSR